VLLERLAESPETELILLDRGFCGVCPASGTATSRAHPAEAVLAEVQALLHAIGLAPEHRPRRLERPLPIRRMNQDGSLPLMEARLSRRDFFTGRTPATETRSNATSEARHDVTPETPTGYSRRRLLAALERLARPETALPARLFPRLTANADCADHRLCAGACPSGALQGVQDTEARGLRFAPDDCLACGVCIQLCPEQALTLNIPETEPETAPPPREPRWISRHARRICPECDTEHTTDAPLCPACRRDQDLGREVWRTLFGTAA
jgi:ferredoxin